MKKYCMVSLLGCFFSVFPFSYDYAIKLGQKGCWKEMYDQLNTILVDDPDRADILYDAAVAAHNINNMQQSYVYFVRAAENASEDILKIQAYYNAANDAIELKKLSDALSLYDKVLAIDPAHEYARHNRSIVQEMIKEQESQQNNSEQQKQDKNQQQKKDEHTQQDQPGQEGNDGQKNQQQNGQQGQDDQQSCAGQESSSGQKQDGSHQDVGQSQHRDNGDDTGANDQHSKQKREDGGDQANAADKQKGHDDVERKEKSHEKSHDTKDTGDDKQGDQHRKTSEDKDTKKENASVASAHDTQQQNIQDPWLIQVLEVQEQKDKALNKQLIQSKVRQGGGKNAHNSW